MSDRDKALAIAKEWLANRADEIASGSGDTALLNAPEIEAIARALLAAEEERTRLEATADKAAESLVFMQHIYRGYSVENRGPAGCVWDALTAIAPDIAAEVSATDYAAVYARRWAEPDDHDTTKDPQ